MSQTPSRFRKTVLAIIALGSTALAACVADAPARPGVDYGYVAGTYSTATATPYVAAPYDDPYYDDSYNGYNGYNGPYYGGAYYGNGYYGPSTTYIYTRDRYYPGYSYRSRGNSYRDDRRPGDRDHSGDRDHDSRDHGWQGHGGNDGHDDGRHDNNGGDHSGRGNWNHDRPGRPDGRPGNASPHADDHPRPVMGVGRPSPGPARAPGNGYRAERRDPPPRAAVDKPDSRRAARARD